MFTKEVLDQLQALAATEQFLDTVSGKELKSNVAVLPESFGLHSLERYQEHLDHFSGSFETIHISEFARYNKLHEQEGTKTFVDAESMKAKSIFDLGTVDKPLHCKHRAVIKLNSTAPFKALIAIDAVARDQRDTSDWLDDYSDYLQAFSSAGEKIEMPKAIEAIRTLTYEHTRGSERSIEDFSQQQSQYEAMATKTKDELQLPAVFVFTCVPYVGLPERRFELRVSILKNEVIVLRIKLFEEIKEKIGEDFLALIRSKFEEHKVSHETFIGTF